MIDEPMSMENYRRIMAKAEEDIAKLRAGLPMPNADAAVEAVAELDAAQDAMTEELLGDDLKGPKHEDR